MKVSFGIDVGGTNIKIGKFENHKLLKKYFVQTDISSKDSVIKQIISEINKELSNDKTIVLEKIGIGIPGPVVNGVVLAAQNINWYEKVDLKSVLQEYFPDAIIEVHNDANAASLGEFNYGSGKEYESIVFVTLGTGIGGGIIINGNLIEGANGSCGEIGHINIDNVNGRECSCGLKGCFEQYASATGIVKTAEEVFSKSKKNIDGLNAKKIFDLAFNNDLDALKVIDITLDYLALGLSNICNTLNPKCVIIGGGVSNGLAPYMDKLQELFDKYAFYSIKGTKIKLSELKNDAGIYGLS